MSNSTATSTKPVTHFLSIKDCSRDQLEQMFDLAYTLREQREQGIANDPILKGKTLIIESIRNGDPGVPQIWVCEYHNGGRGVLWRDLSRLTGCRDRGLEPAARDGPVRAGCACVPHGGRFDQRRHTHSECGAELPNSLAVRCRCSGSCLFLWGAFVLRDHSSHRSG